MGINMVPDLIQATDIARYYSSLMKITWMSEKALAKVRSKPISSIYQMWIMSIPYSLMHVVGESTNV